MNKISYLYLIFTTTTLLAQSNNSKEILQKIDAYRVPHEQFYIKTKITLLKNGQVQETAIFDAYMNGSEKSLVIAKEFKTRGMKLLYVNENMWIHLPNSRRPIRITPIQRLMGEASNGDVARVGLGEDYTAEIVASDTIDAVPCHKIKLMANDNTVTYHKIFLYVRIKDYRPIKAQYYLISGKHIKTAFFDQFQQLAGRLILAQMTIYDELRKNHKTIIEYLEIQEKTLAAKYFNKNYLIHINDL